jgi:hypothetical protein
VTIVIRILLGILALIEIVVGGWNQFLPASFYERFPTVDLTPPFSEHYARDFGGATLAIAFLLVLALVRPRAHFVIPAAIAYGIFAIPHFVFHALHLEHATGFEAVMLNLLNGLVVIVALGAIVLTVGRDRRVKRD